MSATATESELERQVREEQEEHQRQVDEANAKGKLIEVPRIAVVLDDTDPTVIKLAFSGSIDLDRGIAKDVAFYNSLRDGKTADLEIEVHVAGAKTTHRRDSEGDVDAVVQTKSLLVTNVTVTD